MKFTTPLVLLAAFALSAEAPPPRATGLNIPTAQSAQILTACIEKRLGQFTVQELANGGISIRYGEYKSLLIHRQPTLYFDLTAVDGNQNIAVSYRHPMSKETAANTLRKIGRKCFPYELDAAGGGTLPDAG